MPLRHREANRHSAFSRFRYLYDGCTYSYTSYPPAAFDTRMLPMYQLTIHFSSDPRIVIPSTAGAYCGRRYREMVPSQRRVHSFRSCLRKYYGTNQDASWQRTNAFREREIEKEDKRKIRAITRALNTNWQRQVSCSNKNLYVVAKSRCNIWISKEYSYQ